LTKAKGHNWIDKKQRGTTLTMTVYTASLSRGKKLIRSVNAITSKAGIRDPIVPNAKTWDRVPADPSRSRVLVAPATICICPKRSSIVIVLCYDTCRQFVSPSHPPALTKIVCSFTLTLFDIGERNLIA